MPDFEGLSDEELPRGRSYCGPITELPGERCQVEVINTRNSEKIEQGHVGELSNLVSSIKLGESAGTSQQTSTVIIEKLSEQVDSIKDMIIILEKRLTTVEEELRK